MTLMTQGRSTRLEWPSRRDGARWACIGALAALSACGGGGGGSTPFLPVAATPTTPVATPAEPAVPEPAVALQCNDSIMKGFKPDANTSVLLVKAFKKGEAITLASSATSQTPVASSDLCMVKLNVGPGNAGPVAAPSTSPGIGIEIWLPTPEKWNQRIHVVGGGGFAGGVQGSVTSIAGTSGAVTLSPVAIASVEGAVSASTDTGHPNTNNGGAFAMNPDGTINQALWADFSSRSLHEMAVKTKALATAYYGAAPKYSYWDGFSTGGRQGMKEAQLHPEDFDGILAGAPAFNWSKFITAELYPQVVFQRDLGGVPLTTGQQDLASNAAIAACDVVGGQHLGYITDPSACRYDPVLDQAVLCAASGGVNTTPDCLTVAQANAINKIWYGMTADGSVPSPAADNGWATSTSDTAPSGAQRWYGLARGTSLYAAGYASYGLNGLASPRGPFTTATDQVALELQNPSFAGSSFVNASGNGSSLWKTLSYEQLSNAFDRGIALQSQFNDINTDNPNLSAFKSRGGKLLHYHGLADELIMPQGSINYYNRVLAQMEGLANVQSFYRLFLVPGLGHGMPNGTSNPTANNPTMLPSQLYSNLTDWVEKGIAPNAVTLTSLSSTPVAKSRPICAYPKKAMFISGDPQSAASYSCS